MMFGTKKAQKWLKTTLAAAKPRKPSAQGDVLKFRKGVPEKDSCILYYSPEVFQTAIFRKKCTNASATEKRCGGVKVSCTRFLKSES